MAIDNDSASGKKGNACMQWLVAMLANTTLLTYGFQAGWVSPMTKVLQSVESPAGHPLSDHEISWIASALCISAMFGVSLFAYIVDRFGRKAAVLIMAALQALCWIMKLSSANIAVLIIARLCGGLSAGGCYNVVPMYVREISQDDIRGVLGSFIILFQNIGILIMFAMGAYFNYYTVLWIVLWVPILTIVMMLKAPESPAFLVKKGKVDEAASTIAFLRKLAINDKIIQNEIDYMKNQEVTYKSLPKVTFKTIFKNKAWHRGCIINVIIVGFQPNSGNFATLTYSPTILKSAGVTWNPELQTLSFPAVMILASFISMSCVEKFGRKEAASTIAFLRKLAINDKIIQNEIDYMKNQEVTYKSLPKVTFKTIFKNKAWHRGCIINVIIVGFQPNSGNFATLTYSPTILKSAGVTWNPELQTLSFPAVMILASFISMSCVEKFGRKPLISIAFAVAVLSHLVLGTVMLIQHQGGSTPGWIPVFAIITYVTVYAGGISPMPYIIMAEMFNFQIRAKVMGCLVTQAWFISFVQLAVFTAVANFLGTYTVVYRYAGINLCGALVSLVFLPETKGKTAEQIELDLLRK